MIPDAVVSVALTLETAIGRMVPAGTASNSSPVASVPTTFVLPTIVTSTSPVTPM